MIEIEIKSLQGLPTIENNAIGPAPFVIEENTYNSLSYDDFFNNHMRKNTPCIIRKIGTTWESSKKWATNDIINYEYLNNRYGHLNVPVTDCKNITFDNQPRSEMQFSDYLNYLKNNTRDKMMYLKDWHLRRNGPDNTFYMVPALFGSDWLNEYAEDKQRDDFMFVYIGPKGSWTPLHADVYSSFSWSVNVVGRKKWLLFPPGEEEKLKDKFKNVVLQFDPEKHKDKNVVYYEIVQEKNDAIFVPSNWYHQVENEQDTISVNHNWVNGCNITKVWQALTKALDSVKKEIDELKNLPDFSSMCQTMLKHLFGMNYQGFANMIIHIAEKRLAQMQGAANFGLNDYALGRQHCMYDLKRLNDVIIMMQPETTFVDIDFRTTEHLVLLLDAFTYMFQ